MRPSLPLALAVLVVIVGIVALVGVSGVAEHDGRSRPSSTETTVLEQGPFQGSPIDG